MRRTVTSYCIKDAPLTSILLHNEYPSYTNSRVDSNNMPRLLYLQMYRSNGSRRSNGAACQKKQLTSAGSSPIAVMLRQRWQQPIAVIQWVPFVHVLICRIESDGVRFHVLLCHRCQKAESEQCTAHLLHDTSDLHTTARYRHQPEQCLGHFGCCPK